MTNLILIGAGSAGEHLLKEILKDEDNFDYNIIGFLDADEEKHGKKIKGYEVLGDHSNIDSYINEYDIDEIIISTTSIDHDTINRIYKTARQYEVEIETLPSFEDLFIDESFTKQLREITVDDLLGRESTNINKKSIEEYIYGQTILVTGAAGSIGREISKQIAKYKPDKIIILDINENNLYFLKLFLQRHFEKLDVELEICNIREKEKVEHVFNVYNPDIVFHAAAHKHVPLMEKHIEEAVKNNVFGTNNLLELSDENDVNRFVLISTDKAVNPTNIMGATKRLSELLLENKNNESLTSYMAVRFGNVLGSDGSVVPLFKSLLEEGRDITVTHEDVSRYFMTIPEAAQLVLEAGYIGDGGEVFVLDMGEPVKIMDLAKRLIKLSGLELGKDVDIEITGLRPGEKLHEELMYDIDSCMKTQNDKIYISEIKNSQINLNSELIELKEAAENIDREQVKTKLKELVPNYQEVDNKKEG